MLRKRSPRPEIEQALLIAYVRREYDRLITLNGDLPTDIDFEKIEEAQVAIHNIYKEDCDRTKPRF